MIGLTGNRCIGANIVTDKAAVVPMREMRQSGDRGGMLNAAERNLYGGEEGFSVRYIGKKRNIKEKEVMKDGELLNVSLRGRSCPVERGKFAVRSVSRKSWGETFRD